MSIWRILLIFVCCTAAIKGHSETQISERPNKIVPIVNTGGQASISNNGLWAIFRMRLRHWSDDSPITVFILEENDPIHRRFCKEILNIFPSQLRRAWNRLVFSGSGQAPIKVSSQEEMLKSVASTPGAIGYAYEKDLIDQVRILKIQ